MAETYADHPLMKDATGQNINANLAAILVAIQNLNPGPAGSNNSGFMGPANYLSNGLILEASALIPGLESSAHFGFIEKLRVVEAGTVTLTNSLEFPFNNSKQTIALQSRRDNSKYIVAAEVDTAIGNVGEIVISDRMTNGFAIAFTGSASSVTVNYFVIGGFGE